MAKTNTEYRNFVKNFFKVEFTIFDVAGSPGPFDKKIPSGFREFIVSKLVLIGTIVTLAFKLENFLKYF